MNTVNPPPAPTGLTSVPSAHEDLLFTKGLSTVVTVIDSLSDVPDWLRTVLKTVSPVGSVKGRVSTTRTLTVHGGWSVVNAVGFRKGADLSRTEKTTEGVSQSKTQTTEFGANLGVSGDLVSIGASLKEITSDTTTLTESHESSFTLTEPTATEDSFIVLWQQYRLYELAGRSTWDVHLETVFGNVPISSGNTPFNTPLMAHLPIYVPTSFPAG
jgi:hypothetical protein